MPRSPESALAARLSRIKDVADDLTRELVRVRCLHSSAVHDMAAFIKAEANRALSVVKKSKSPTTRLNAEASRKSLNSTDLVSGGRSISRERP